MSAYTKYRLAKSASILCLVIGSLLAIIGFVSLVISGFDWTLYGKLVHPDVILRSGGVLAVGAIFFLGYVAIVEWIEINC